MININEWPNEINFLGHVLTNRVCKLSMGNVVSATNSVIYDVSVTTGQRRGAGTDANVFLTIVGKH